MVSQSTWGVPVAAQYVIVDIETGNCSEAEVREFFEKTYQPPGNYKDAAKIAAHRAEALAKAMDRAALLPTSPILAIGLKSETELRCLHAMAEHAPAVRQLDGVTALVEGFSDTREMLASLNSFFAHRVGPETVLSGFNVFGFDFAAIRRAMARLRLPIPSALLDPAQPSIDLMRTFCRLFSGSSDTMISCREAAETLGIEAHGVSGAAIPPLFEAQEFDLIVTKNLLDVLLEERLFLVMTTGRG